MQGEALRLLEARVRSFGSPPAEVRAADGTPEGQRILREILGTHADYAGESSPVVPLDLARLAIPRAADSSVPAFGDEDPASPNSGPGFLRQFLLPTSEGRERVRSSELKRPYLDPCLRGSGSRYGEFVAMLVGGGVAEVCEEAGECEVGAFAVRKKDGGRGL